MSREDEILDVFANNRYEAGPVFRSDLDEYEVYTIDCDGTVVGAALVEVLATDDKYATIHAIAVAENARGQGIGAGLVEKVFQRVPSTVLQAKCRTDLSANEFYAQTGWTLQRQTPDGHMNVWEYTAR